MPSPATPIPTPPPSPPPAAVPKPPTVTKAPPEGRKFPCKACGAKLDFDPTQQALKCPYCGHVEPIGHSDNRIVEHDYLEYLKTQSAGQTTITGHANQVRCPACGAVVLLEDKVVTQRCPFCTTHLENKPEAAEAMIPPESLLPFKIDNRKAREAFNRWIASLWFAPSELKQLANLGQLNGVYLPFWTYDSMTYSRYQGMRGDNYTDTETYTETNANGETETKTRTVVRTIWTPAAGEVQHFFDDVLVCASKSVPNEKVSSLQPWDLPELVDFKAEYLSSFTTERYAVGLEDGFERAKGIMDGTIRQLICRDIGGDQQTITSLETKHQGVTFKHLLLPVWLAAYRYREKLYRILVNARTGSVVGDRPYSVWKIATLVAGILFVLGTIWYVWFLNQNHQSPQLRPRRAAIVSPLVRPERNGGGRDRTMAQVSNMPACRAG